MKKCKGGCQMKSGGKVCSKCGCEMEDEEYEKGEKEEKEMRSGGMACMKCGGKMHKSGGTVSSCMKCGGGKYTFGGKVNWSKKKVTSKYASGGMIKRADGSYSQRGLWDNIRANAGSGKKPTKQMLEQEKKIKQEMAVGGEVDTGCPDGMVKDPITGKCVYPYTTSNPNDSRIKSYSDSTTLYNNYIKNFNTIKSGGKYHNTIETTKPAEYLTSGTWKETNPNNPIVYKKIDKDFGYNVIGKEGYPDITFMSNKKIQPIATETFTRKESQYPSVKSFDEYAKKMKLRPNATFSEKPNEARWVGYELQKYKAPTQPVIYKPAVRVPVTEYTQQDLDRAFEKRREQEDYAAYEKWRAENPLPEPEPRMNDEMEISYYKPVDMPMIKPGLIPSNDIIPNTNTGIKYQKESGQGSYPTMSGEEQGMTNKKGKRKYSFGGAISSMKKYSPGGEIDNTLITNDPEIQLGKGAFNVSEPAYDANKIMSRVFNNALSIKESEQPTTKQTGYKEEVEKNKVVKDDKSLPNWGRAKKEQQILNELIRKDIAAGKSKMDLLVEDDIIGDYTLGAMRAYEASGQYTRPELFKDKWLAEYKKQWDEMQKSKSSASNQETKTETQTESINPNANPNPSFNFFSPDWGKLSSDTKANTNTNTNQNKPQGKGWPKQQLLKEGGVEIDTKELSPKDFDTYKPILGITKSTKGIRATGRDRSDAYFDAVEKGQYFDLNGLKANTSLRLINDLLSKSKKAIIIPRGQDPYGRDLNDIYLQDENNPDQYHALDSLGVVNREAVFGKYITGEEDKMTDRQKMITGQAQEKGGFKYNMSPWLFRETQDYNNQSSKENKIEYTKTDDEIINRKPKTKAASESAKNYREWTVESMIPANAARTSTTLVLRSGNETKVTTVSKPMNKLIGSEVEVDIDGRKRKIYVDPYKKY